MEIVLYIIFYVVYSFVLGQPELMNSTVTVNPTSNSAGSTSNISLASITTLPTSSMSATLQDNTIILAATFASSVLVILFITITAAISVLMIILIWKRINNTRDRQHSAITEQVALHENVCYTTSNILFNENNKEYVQSSIIVYKCVIPACRIDSDYVEVDDGKPADDGVVLQENAAYCLQVHVQLQQNVSYVTSTENNKYVLLQSMYVYVIPCLPGIYAKYTRECLINPRV